MMGTLFELASGVHVDRGHRSTAEPWWGLVAPPVVLAPYWAFLQLCRFLDRGDLDFIRDFCRETLG